MNKLGEEFLAAKEAISRAEKIVIISHRGPDGDSVGANLALRCYLAEQLKKSVVSACVDPPPESASHLRGWSAFVQDFEYGAADLIISVDVGGSKMLGFFEKKPELSSGRIPFINIDHHASNDKFGTINVVDPHAAAACQIIYHFLEFCGAQFNRHIATCLLHGLYFDTGSFMHSNTSPEVLEIASRLLWKGADFKTSARRQFRSMTVPQMKLIGRMLERAHVNDKDVAVSTLTQQDFRETGAESDATTGAIDLLNSIPEGKISCLLYEDGSGRLKGSLRTRSEHINVAALAGMFGGGGHKKASGFSLPGSIMIDGKKVIIEE